MTELIRNNAWIEAQLQQLGIGPGDHHYDDAKQAASRGWPASNIRRLLWPAGNQETES